MGNPPALFISYARVNKGHLVTPLIKILTDGGYNVWFDYNIVPGTKWREELSEQIRTCDVFIYAMTPESIVSENCKWEVEEASKLHKPIIPIRLQSNIQLPEFLGSLQWVDCSEGFTTEAVAKLHYAIRNITTISAKKNDNSPDSTENTAKTGLGTPSKVENRDPLDTGEFAQQIGKYLNQTTFPKLSISTSLGILRLEKMKPENQALLVATIDMYYRPIRTSLISLAPLLPQAVAKETALTDMGWHMGRVTEEGKVIASLHDLYIAWELPLKLDITDIAQILKESIRAILGTQEVYVSHINISPRL